MFLWHYLSGCPAWALPSTLPGGARTFLPDSLSLIGAAAQLPWPSTSVPQSTLYNASAFFLICPGVTIPPDSTRRMATGTVRSVS